MALKMRRKRGPSSPRGDIFMFPLTVYAIETFVIGFQIIMLPPNPPQP